MDGSLPTNEQAGRIDDAQNRELLVAVFQGMEEVKPGLAKRAVCYVMEEDPASPVSLFQDAHAAKCLKLGSGRAPEHPLYQLFARGTMQAPQWLRFAELIYEADFWAPRINLKRTREKSDKDGVLTHLLAESAKCGLIEGSSLQTLEALSALCAAWPNYHGGYWPDLEKELEAEAEHIVEFSGVVEHMRSHPEIVEKYIEEEWRSCKTQDLAAQLSEHAELFVEALSKKLKELFVSDSEYEQKSALDALRSPIIAIEPFQEQIWQWSQDSESALYESAAELLPRFGELAQARAQALFEEPSKESKMAACRLLYACERNEAMVWLSEQRDGLEDDSVRDYLEHVIRCASSREGEGIGLYLKEQAEARSFKIAAPLSEAAIISFKVGLRSTQKNLAKNERELAPWEPSSLNWYQEQLEGLQLEGKHSADFFRIPSQGEGSCWRLFFEHEEVGYVHLIRLLLLMGELPAAHEHRPPHWEPWGALHPCVALFSEVKGGLDATALFAACELVGASHYVLLNRIRIHDDGSTEPQLDIRQLVDYCERSPLQVFHRTGLDPMRGWQLTSKRMFGHAVGAYRILAQMPPQSNYVEEELIERVLDEDEREAALVRACLASMPRKAERISQGLLSSESQARLRSARWLAEEGCSSEIPKLKDQLANEKDAQLRVVIYESLLDLGVPASELMNPEVLLQEAERGLPKKLPAKMAWIPLELLPPLSWRDGGEVVDQKIVRWLVYLCFKLEQAEPSKVLRGYMDLMDPEQVGAFGQALMLLWFSRDDRFFVEKDPSSNAFNAELMALCAIEGFDSEKAMEAIRGYLSQKKMSISGSKGILALVAACTTLGALDMIDDYVRTHGVKRTALCNHLLVTLGAINDMRAVGAMAGLATGLRRGSLKENAQEQLIRIAARKRWSLDELHDRTLPSAGLDAQGQALLDLGPRELKMKLGDELVLVVEDEAGKVKKTMPAARKSDDEALHAAAKKRFSATKKVVKQLVKDQSKRLEENMFGGRTWAVEDWERYIRKHPVVGKMATQLIWVERKGDEETRLFRPLEDGSFSDVEDEALELDPQAKIQIAHASFLSPELVQAWQAHLSDYEVALLFPQLEKIDFELSESQRGENLYAHPCKVSLFHLRNQCSKAGFVGEEPSDGGGFYAYERRFEGMGLLAQVVFSGAWVPLEEQEVEIEGLCFEKEGQRVPLKEVPPILLTRCVQLLGKIGESS